MNPLVSIVLPTYNRARDLERALKSVRAQTYPHWEVLVVDNNSTDETDSLVESFSDPRIKLLKTYNNGVIAVSRNVGIKHAAGEYVAFLDSDDWWMPKKLDESLKYLEQGADVVYHALYVVTNPGQKLFWRTTRTRTLKSPVFSDLIANGNALMNSSVVIRRRILERVNGLSEDQALVASEDYDLWLRAAKVTDNFSRIPCTLGYYWLGDGNHWSGRGIVFSPERVLATLRHLEVRYAEDFINSQDVVSWLHYVRGKAYYRLGFYDLARKHLKMARSGSVPFSTNLRVLWILLLSTMHRNSKDAI